MIFKACKPNVRGPYPSYDYPLTETALPEGNVDSI